MEGTVDFENGLKMTPYDAAEFQALYQAAGSVSVVAKLISYREMGIPIAPGSGFNPESIRRFEVMYARLGGGNAAIAYLIRFLCWHVNGPWPEVDISDRVFVGSSLISQSNVYELDFMKQMSSNSRYNRLKFHVAFRDSLQDLGGLKHMAYRILNHPPRVVAREDVTAHWNQRIRDSFIEVYLMGKGVDALGSLFAFHVASAGSLQYHALTHLLNTIAENDIIAKGLQEELRVIKPPTGKEGLIIWLIDGSLEAMQRFRKKTQPLEIIRPMDIRAFGKLVGIFLGSGMMVCWEIVAGFLRMFWWLLTCCSRKTHKRD